MLQGKSMKELAGVVLEQLKTKKDFIIPTSFLFFHAARHDQEQASYQRYRVVGD